MSDRDDIEIRILKLCEERGPDKTICPSEVARVLDDNKTGWRDRMPAVREAAGRLADQGLIMVTQKSKLVDPSTAKGPIRLGIRRA